MRLFLAVALLIVALVAFTEAQDDTIEAKLNKFGEQFSEVAGNVAEKIKTSFQDVHNSDTAAKIRSWWAEQVERVGNAFQ